MKVILQEKLYFWSMIFSISCIWDSWNFKFTFYFDSTFNPSIFLKEWSLSIYVKLQHYWHDVICLIKFCFLISFVKVFLKCTMIKIKKYFIFSFLIFTLFFLSSHPSIFLLLSYTNQYYWASLVETKNIYFKNQRPNTYIFQN